MQLATINSPKFLGWSKYIADAARDEPPIEYRLAVAPSEEAAYSFVDFQEEHFYCDPEHIGWDFHRLYGGPDGAGRDMFDTAMAAGGRRCSDEIWASFNRPRAPSDCLLVDGMDEAVHYGWEAPPEIAAAIETLRDMRAARTAQRKAVDKARDATVFARSDRFLALDEAAYGDWLDDGKPDGRALKFSRWKARDATEEAQLARYEAHRMQQMPGTPMPAAPLPDMLTSSAEFIGAFVPAEFLIDGIVQRRYFYSMTAQTGVGKTAIAMRWMAHVVSGKPIGDREVQQGSALYFAGENPDDVRARWLVLSREMGIDPNTDKITWIVGAKDLNATATQISGEVARKGLNLAYVVIDTAAAYNVGDDENSNTQAGNYARQLRSLTNLPGGPCVVALCHPTKRAGNDDLMPRGGGAFLAEVDGNMAVVLDDSLLKVAPFGKYRGDMSWQQRFEIDVVKDHPKLKDARGRQMNSVVARPVGDGVAAIMEKRTDADMQLVLSAVDRTPSATPSDLARMLGWTYGAKSEPHVNRVRRNLDRLAKDKLVREVMGKWRATEAGQRELNAIDAAKATIPKPLPPR
ncbi:AAA domain-containing protein [Bradyrhizobium erythrophlei]|nr:AAA domain-containing protein [Bradyrhizobium erythrophlei]